MSKGHVLIADDDSAIRLVLQKALARAGFEPKITSNATTLWEWIKRGEGDVVVTDVIMPDENIFDLLPQIKAARPELPIIVISAENTLMTAITATELGAYEYLPKPFDLNELVRIVERAFADVRAGVAAEREPLEEQDTPLIGRAPAMQEIYRVLARLTQSDLTVLINGESGTGKELVARVLHDYSKRKHNPFIAINMAAIPSELIESELFGHEKGAFTGAIQKKQGHFEQANGGTLFLDEIGDMPMKAQTRLLRVLQEGEYVTVGGTTAIKTNVRVVAATHQNLQSLISRGQFREDLFYRLNVVPLNVPPLRERKQDIGDLVNHFLKLAAGDGSVQKVFSAGALEKLKSYDWPGNVRELENFIHRITALYARDLINSDLVLSELSAQSISAPESLGGGRNIPDLIEQAMEVYFRSFGGELPPPGLYHRVLEEVEAPLISACLTATRGNQLQAAKLLGLNRNTLRDKIRKLNIDPKKIG